MARMPGPFILASVYFHNDKAFYWVRHIELIPSTPKGLASRPPVIKVLVARLPVDRLYQIKATGQKGTITSYCEDGTITLIVDGTYSRVMVGHHVFGLKPEAIEECDLPGPDASVGNFAEESPGTCPECAVKHGPNEPHNQQSLAYQYDFYGKNGRWPTW